jgi:hypothetical protein
MVAKKNFIFIFRWVDCVVGTFNYSWTSIFLFCHVPRIFTENIRHLLPRLRISERLSIPKLFYLHLKPNLKHDHCKASQIRWIVVTEDLSPGVETAKPCTSRPNHISGVEGTDSSLSCDRICVTQSNSAFAQILQILRWSRRNKYHRQKYTGSLTNLPNHKSETDPCAKQFYPLCVYRNDQMVDDATLHTPGPYWFLDLTCH